ncbi:MAG: helix-turn-helix domain-containing protein, partial [Paludibacteraceae bacterium]
MKKKKHLTREQRYQISALLQTGTRQKEIARIVGTSESTISREIKRNSS